MAKPVCKVCRENSRKEYDNLCSRCGHLSQAAIDKANWTDGTDTEIIAAWAAKRAIAFERKRIAADFEEMGLPLRELLIDMRDAGRADFVERLKDIMIEGGLI